MKVRSAIKVLCPHCYMVRRGKHMYVYCKETPKHKQRQAFHTQLDRSMAATVAPMTIPTAATIPFKSAASLEMFCSPCAVPSTMARGKISAVNKFLIGGSAGVIFA